MLDKGHGIIALSPDESPDLAQLISVELAQPSGQVVCNADIVMVLREVLQSDIG